MNNIIDQDELERVTGYSKPSQLMSCLKKQGIPYYLGKGGRIWTTLDAINSKLLGIKTESVYELK